MFAVFCAESGDRVGTLKFHKQDKKGIAWKDRAKKISEKGKFCQTCMKIGPVKLKEERHSA